MEKTTTVKQIEANKVNALKGGVKTQEGKEIVSKNAIKHGLTGSMVLNEEENGLYNSIVNVLVEELNPVSLLETIILERIALYYMKLQRVVRLDTKQICIEKLNEEVAYLNYIKPERTAIFQELADMGMYDRSDKEKETFIVEIENKISTIRDEIYTLNKNYIGQTSIDVLEKFHRYETSLENRLYKGIREYYKIKAISGGGPVIDVNIEK